jgi:hypothetical protein
MCRYFERCCHSSVVGSLRFRCEWLCRHDSNDPSEGPKKLSHVVRCKKFQVSKMLRPFHSKSTFNRQRASIKEIIVLETSLSELCQCSSALALSSGACPRFQLQRNLLKYLIRKWDSGGQSDDATRRVGQAFALRFAAMSRESSFLFAETSNLLWGTPDPSLNGNPELFL